MNMLKTATQLVVMAALLSLSHSGVAESLAATSSLPTPPEVWKDYDPDAGDYKEEIIVERTENGIYYRESYISAYVNDEEIRVYCKYAVKSGAKNGPGLMDVHGWMGAPNPDMSYVNDGWAVLSHGYCGKAHNRTHYTKASSRVSTTHRVTLNTPQHNRLIPLPSDKVSFG